MKSSIIPGIKYKNCPAAIEYLCQKFGFHTHLVVPGEGAAIAHAQLIFGNSMVMLGTLDESEYSAYFKTPSDINGINTQSCYLIVEDIETHYAHSKSLGVEMVMELQDQPYGGKLYTCKDPEGVIWNFGSYNPWEEV